jgi:hypothetical protein
MRQCLIALLLSAVFRFQSSPAQTVEGLPQRSLPTMQAAPTGSQISPNQAFDRRPAGAAPTVTAAAMNPSQIRVTWTSVPGAIGYLVRRNPATTPQLLTPTAISATELVDKELYPNTPTSYEVWADFGPESPNSPGRSVIVTATTPPPENPTGFTAFTNTSGDSYKPSYSISLTWKPSPGAAYYEVKGDGQLVYEGAALGTSVRNVPPGDHHYELVAYYGPTGAAIGNTGAPATVWGFAYRISVTATMVGPVTVRVQWVNFGNATGYDVFRQKVDPASSQTPALQEKDIRSTNQKQNEFFEYGIEKGATYRYYVDAHFYGLTGSASGAVRITVPQ